MEVLIPRSEDFLSALPAKKTTNANKITRVGFTFSKIVTDSLVERVFSNPDVSSPDEAIPPITFDNSKILFTLRLLKIIHLGFFTRGYIETDNANASFFPLLGSP